MCENGVYYKQSCSYVPSVASNNPPNHVASHTLSVKTQGLVGVRRAKVKKVMVVMVCNNFIMSVTICIKSTNDTYQGSRGY